MSTVPKTMLLLVALVMVGAVSRPDEPPAAMRVLRTTVEVDATPAQVWDAFTTKEGVESWMVPLAEVDFRMGGTLKTNYNKSAGIGGPGTIVHHILAYDPYRMIAMRFEAPETAGDKKLAESCWWMVYIDEAGPGKTRITESMAGWGEGPEWDKVYGFFEKGNEWTMQQLAKKFAKPEAGAPAGRDVLALLGKLAGGEWVHETARPDGPVFRVRNVYMHGPDGISLMGNGWLGDGEGNSQHGSLQVWRDPAGGAVRFQNIDEYGGVARGEIARPDENTLVWDWVITSTGGKKTPYKVKMIFEGSDAYRFVLTHVAPGEAEKTLVEVKFARVDKAPEAFTKLKPAHAAASAPPGKS